MRLTLRVLQSKAFAKFARKSGLHNEDLLNAVQRASQGLIDANLGGGLIKLRIARAGQGKSGGFRSVLVYRATDRAIFVYGFAKNVQANISDADLLDLRELARFLLRYTEKQLTQAVLDGHFLEVEHEG